MDFNGRSTMKIVYKESLVNTLFVVTIEENIYGRRDQGAITEEGLPRCWWALHNTEPL